MDNFDLRKYLAENRLLKEETNRIAGKDGITILVSDYVKNHIMTHNKPGIGSVFKKGVSEDDILRMVKAISTKVSGKGGPYQINSPGAGYDLVLPIEDAKKLRDAKEGTVEKQEGPNKVKVPSISTSQPIKDFTTDKVSLLVFPSNPQFLPDDVKNDKSVLDQIEQGKNYSIVTAFPGNPDIPRASEWNGKYAVIIPDQKVNESITTLNEVIDDKKFGEMIEDQYSEMEGEETSGGEEFNEVNNEEPGRAAEIVSIEIEKELNKMPKGEFKEFEIESEVYSGNEKIGFVLIGKYPEGDTDKVAEYDFEIPEYGGSDTKYGNFF